MSFAQSLKESQLFNPGALDPLRELLDISSLLKMKSVSKHAKQVANEEIALRPPEERCFIETQKGVKCFQDRSFLESKDNACYSYCYRAMEDLVESIEKLVYDSYQGIPWIVSDGLEPKQLYSDMVSLETNTYQMQFMILSGWYLTGEEIVLLSRDQVVDRIVDEISRGNNVIIEIMTNAVGSSLAAPRVYKVIDELSPTLLSKFDFTNLGSSLATEIPSG